MILIHPFAQAKRVKSTNAKNYPYWKPLLNLLSNHSNHKIIQVGQKGEPRITPDFRTDLSLEDLKELLRACQLWIAIDSFLPHLAHHVGKPGIVIWSVSDPNIYGYPENCNLLKDRKYLYPNQFGFWEESALSKESYLDPAIIHKKVIEILTTSSAA